MKMFLALVVLVAALVALPASNAWGQCRAGGSGQGGGGAAQTALGSGGGVSTGQLLTGPGSWAYDVMLQQQAQAAYRQQQQAIAYAKAQKKQEKFARRLAAAEKHRAEALYKREFDRQARSLASSNE